jgi:hypothetical protein
MDVTYEHCERVTGVINGKLDKLDEAIRGNGKPGLIVRMDRIERGIGLMMRLGWLLLGVVTMQAAPQVARAISWLVGGQ